MKICVGFIVVLIILALSVVNSIIPDLSWDNYVDDIVSISPFVQLINNIRYNNEDKPDHCRNDLCTQFSTSTKRRGHFTWPQTSIGYRRNVRCPYDVTGGHYGYVDCNYSNITGPSRVAWGTPVTKHCPEPPLTEVIKRLKTELSQNGNRAETWWQEGYADILDTIREYPDYPIYPDNVRDTLDLADIVLTRAVDTDQAPSTPTLDVIFRCLDWVTTTNEKMSSLSYQQYSQVIWLFTVLTDMLVLPPGEREMTIPGNMATVIVNQTDSLILPLMEFSARDPVFYNAMRTDVSIDFQNHGTKIVRLLYVALPDYMSHMVTVADTWLLLSVDPEDPEFGEQFETEVMHFRLDHIGPSLYVSVSHDPDEVWSRDVWMQRMTSTHDVMITYTMTPHRDRHISDEGNIQCAWSQPTVNKTDDEWMDTWYGRDCEEIFDDFGGLTCQCNITGYLSIFDKLMRTSNLYYDDYHDYMYPADNDVPPDIGTFMLVLAESHNAAVHVHIDYDDIRESISTLLGFPFSFKLYVASHVLRAISLVCLVATIVSFTLFRKTRRGTPTKILLNLCVSLIVLLLVLYITEAISRSRLGCRISNAIRYYFIMVSLMWNAVEAINMYLMLVKVFNHDIQRFILKAGIVAWGMPMLMVATVFIYSVKGFDGIYLDTCQFRCQLREPVLYYFYLLPMGVIMVFNMVVFAMVLKVIIQTKANIAATKERRTNHCLRLCGALSIMVLLGVPWIFSAFGAIDANEENVSLQTMEGVFHVVFVVCINLQGVFIFVFHCARNAEVREQWKSTLSRTQTENTTFSKSRASTSQDTDLPKKMRGERQSSVL